MKRISEAGHPALLRFDGRFDRGSRSAGFVMELAPGGELKKYVEAKGHGAGISELEVKELAGDIAAGLRAAHSVRIAHRDVKPNNMLLTRVGNHGTLYAGDSRVKVIDFGLAKQHEVKCNGEVVEEALTQGCGTKKFKAPEIIVQRDDRGYNGFLADSWAFGISLFWMTQGFYPWDEADNRYWQPAFIKVHDAQKKDTTLGLEVINGEVK